MAMTRPNNLRAIREERGWTLAEAAEKADISESYLSRLERGPRDLNARTMKRLMKAYGVKPEDIVRADDQPPPSVAEVWARIKPERRTGVLAILEIIAGWDGDDDPDGIPIRGYPEEDRVKRVGSYRKEAVRKHQ
jgi:transcriptional regulator with XRE-family HTH domain